MINRAPIETNTSFDGNESNGHNPLLRFCRRTPFNPHLPRQVLEDNYINKGAELASRHGRNVIDIVNQTATDYLSFARVFEDHAFLGIREMDIDRRQLFKAFIDRKLGRIGNTDEYQFINQMEEIIHECLEKGWELEDPYFTDTALLGENIISVINSTKDDEVYYALRDFIIQSVLDNALWSNVEPWIEPEESNYSLNPTARAI